jgi:molybdate transport system substrate-binding protein
MALFPALACANQTDTASGAVPQELTVFAAVSLSNAFPEIADAFVEEHPGASIAFNFSGSQRLRTQLEFGAGADVFASADRRQMDLAVDAGLIAGDPLPFAGNELVVITPLAGVAENGESVQELGALARNGVKLALAMPEVPVGGYSRDLLRNLESDVPGLGAGYASRVLDNVVTLEPNVRGVLQKVALGEVDAGIVYRTDAATEYALGKVAVISLPDRSNIVAEYPIATLRGAANPQLADEFVRFVVSEKTQTILSRYGFESPAAPQPSPTSEKR